VQSSTLRLRSVLLAACAQALLVSGAYAADNTRLTVASDVPASLTGVVATAAPSTLKPMTVDIALPLTDEAGAIRLADGVSDPKSTLYGQYLTPSQFAARFGASATDYAAVVAWAKSQGLAVRPQNLARTLVSVVGTAPQIEAAFAIKFNYYKDKTGRVFPSAAGQPSLPAAIASRIDAVVGLSRRIGFAPQVKRAPAGVQRPLTAGGTGAGGAYSPADFRTAYGTPGVAAGGPAETMAVFEQGGFFASDITKFVAANKLPASTVTVREVDGFNGGVDDPNVELEAVLDISTILGVTKSSASVIVYEDGEDFSIALLDSLVAMADDKKANIISISYGEDEVIAGPKAMKVERSAFLQLAIQGQTVLVSSGDEGAYGDTGFGLNVADPCTQVYVTCVGGTSLFTGAGEAFYLENVWNDLASSDGATGGGVSATWALPKWQIQPDSNPPVSMASFNGGSNTFRNVPDVAADGDPLTGAAIYSALNGGWIQVGGTSLAAPLYAAFLSIYDQALQIVGRPHVGFYNPALYELGTNYVSYYAFHDVRNGSNGDANEYDHIPGYSAGYNYDNVSGWGSVAGAAGLQLLLEDAVGYKKPPAAATGLAGTMVGSTISVTWVAGKNVPGYLVEVIDPYNGTVLESTLAVTPTATFTGVPKGLAYYAVGLYSLGKDGITENAPVYLQPTK
jgi:kumamolisin